jgi:hypothetical protein
LRLCWLTSATPCFVTTPITIKMPPYHAVGNGPITNQTSKRLRKATRQTANTEIVHCLFVKVLMCCLLFVGWYSSWRFVVHHRKHQQPTMPRGFLAAQQAVVSTGRDRNLSQARSESCNEIWGSSDQIKLEPPKIVSRNPTRRQIPQGLVFCIYCFSSFRQGLKSLLPR